MRESLLLEWKCGLGSDFLGKLLVTPCRKGPGTPEMESGKNGWSGQENYVFGRVLDFWSGWED